MNKGEDGHLAVRVKVEADTTMRREGQNIVSKHYLTLTEALLGFDVKVPTVNGDQTV